MQPMSIYQEIAERTGGDLYIGVVGPVRTGKSTFIRSFMEAMVLPGMEDSSQKTRIEDALPQSGSGRTIMTTQLQFVPEEAAELALEGETRCRVRLVDCVGYMAENALGAEEEDAPRMVRTAWHEEEVPFAQAAEEGTRRVIRDYSTMALVLTSDGSATALPREALEAAEKRIVAELQTLGKPFALVVNSAHPSAAETQTLARELGETYGVPAIALDAAQLDVAEAEGLLRALLYEFPAMEMTLEAPGWMRALPRDHWLWQKAAQTLRQAGENFRHLRETDRLCEAFAASDAFQGLKIQRVLPACGRVEATLLPEPSLYYGILSERCGMQIADEAQVMEMMAELVAAKREYDRMASAWEQAQATGYGVVAPSMEELTLEPPERVRQGSQFGMRLKASAPSWHILRVDVQAEVSPAVGTEKQGEALASQMLDAFKTDPDSIWETEIFGRSLADLVREGLARKLTRMPDATQAKMRDALARIVGDEGGGIMILWL